MNTTYECHDLPHLKKLSFKKIWWGLHHKEAKQVIFYCICKESVLNALPAKMLSIFADAVEVYVDPIIDLSLIIMISLTVFKLALLYKVKCLF